MALGYDGKSRLTEARFPMGAIEELRDWQERRLPPGLSPDAAPLTGSGAAGEVVRWRYDRADNRTEERREGTVDRYAYTGGNLLTGAGRTQYTNNTLGERTGKIAGGEFTRYHWNARGLLTRVDLPGGGYVEYRYDAFGRMVYREHHDPGIRGTGRRTEGTHYLWDGMKVVAEYDGTPGEGRPPLAT